MAKAKAQKASAKSAGSGGKGGGSRKGKSTGKGHPMLRKLFFVAVLGAAGYAAFKLPYKGRTVADRVNYYIEHDTDVRSTHEARHTPGTTPGLDAKKDRPAVVADRRNGAGAPVRPRTEPKEDLTQTDRDALDHLIPR